MKKRVLNKNGLFFFDTININFKSKLIMIWLLEDILHQIPKGLHDWHKFIKPEELTAKMQDQGFSNIVIKGFDLTAGMNFHTLTNILLKGLSHPQQNENTELFPIQINEDSSVWYVGKAVKFSK
jgi:2-polyprenyl-6-hydroxyphenyl methylase / 3-demethylubiquinone-9 3-methyltransferase